MNRLKYDLYNLKEQQSAIKIWLRQNDWKIDKHVLGEWASNDPRWVSYINERSIKRAEYDRLEKEIELIKTELGE